MDFIDQIKALGDKVSKMKDQIQTEEATKNAFILPFIQILGYDIFNPTEVIPEYVADIGIKKGEKVDFVIMKDTKPIIIIECKWWGEDLNIHNSQVVRYFNVTETRFAIITNGINYQFFTDLENANKLDKKAFLEFDITDIREGTLNELKKFKKENFELESILYCANELKYSTEIRSILSDNIANPSDNFVKFFADQVYAGRVTSKILEQFKGIVFSTVNNYINDLIHDRIKSVLTQKTPEDIKKQAIQQTENLPLVTEEEQGKIKTTVEEMEAFYIIKSFLRPYVDIKRIFFRDTVNYFNILLDDNKLKLICRFWLNKETKYFSYLDENKTEIKIKINDLDDIYKYSDIIVKSLQQFTKLKEEK
jgi:predicted type IV restriction endonuclease